MPRIRSLTTEQTQELHKWLESKGVIVTSKLSKDFSDATETAALIKKLHPRLVDMHNYAKRHNTQLKFDNWITLNDKVLTKLGMAQTSRTLNNLTTGVPGAIECLLYEIMTLDRTNANVSEQETGKWDDKEEVMTVTVNRKINDNVLQLPQKMILYSVYDNLVQDLKAKEEMLNTANEKVAHLEAIIKMKADRVESLVSQLAKFNEKYEDRTPSPHISSQPLDSLSEV